MATETLLLLVEGPHDLEFCARLLKPRGFERIRELARLQSDHSAWLRLVLGSWPQGGDLLARHPVPMFFSNPTRASVAIVNAAGVDKLAAELGRSLANLDIVPSAVGIVLDADGTELPAARFAALTTAIGGLEVDEARNLAFAPAPGLVNAGPPRCGVFIMPDNQNAGTLEDLLLDAAEAAYPQLKASAADFVSVASALPQLNRSDLREYQKPAGPKKAIAAAMASILRPGKSIQVSIQDNRWLGPESLMLPRIAALKNFLEELLP
jgi:hypothetical protein